MSNIAIKSGNRHIPVIDYGSGWMAVNKPADLSVHNDPKEDLCAMINAYCLNHVGFGSDLGFDPAWGFHAVHRLDRQTSGIILLACRKAVLSSLGIQFQRHIVTKTYQAILHGHMEMGSVISKDTDWHAWHWPLNRKATGRKNLKGQGTRYPCRTRYRILGQSDHYTRVELQPETGRRHQIRRHAALSGHPVIGDKRYSTSRSVRFLRQHYGFKRLALHAIAISLILPDEITPRTLTTGSLPPEMLRLIQADAN